MKKSNIIALAIFAMIMAAVFTMETPQTRSIQNRIGAVFAPFKRTGAEVQNALTGASDEKLTPEQLRAENTKLRIERDELQIYRNRLPDVQAELRRLEALIKFQDRTEFKLIPARIIVRKTSAWTRQATIDKGSLQNIQDGSPVILPYGENGEATALVGRISRANENEADMVFITDELCQAASRIEGADERGGFGSMRGIVKGARTAIGERPRLRLMHLPSGADLPHDDQGRYKPLKVYTWNSNVFPANLLIGTVIDFHQKDASSEAIVEPAINLEDLPYVFVMEQKLDTAPTVPPPPR